MNIDAATNNVLLDLLQDCFADEIAHLRLRLIRNAQAPRFEALRDTHPEIYEDFMNARTGPHEVLLGNRRLRVKVLTDLIENGNRPPAKIGPMRRRKTNDKPSSPSG